jgi:hypothetical protein
MANLLKAKNDDLIRKLFSDENYRIDDDCSMWTRISEQGHETDEWRPKKIRIDSRGYYKITYNRVHLQYHRIMYFKYHGVLDENMVINHIDSNPLNNSKENLEMVSQANNNTHAFRSGGKRPVAGNVTYSQEVVESARRMHAEGFGRNDIMRQLGIKKTSLHYMLNGSTWSKETTEYKPPIE